MKYLFLTVFIIGAVVAPAVLHATTTATSTNNGEELHVLSLEQKTNLQKMTEGEPIIITVLMVQLITMISFTVLAFIWGLKINKVGANRFVMNEPGGKKEYYD